MPMPIQKPAGAFFAYLAIRTGSVPEAHGRPSFRAAGALAQPFFLEIIHACRHSIRRALHCQHEGLFG
jgi:hypothetical protein